jgi:hypothetical protein
MWSSALAWSQLLAKQITVSHAAPLQVTILNA